MLLLSGRVLTWRTDQLECAASARNPRCSEELCFCFHSSTQLMGGCLLIAVTKTSVTTCSFNCVMFSYISQTIYVFPWCFGCYLQSSSSYLDFYVVFISLKTLVLSITSIQIYILEALCTNIGDPSCIYDICIVFFTLFLIIILITYSIFFNTYLFISITNLFILLIVPHNHINCILCIVLFSLF